MALLPQVYLMSIRPDFTRAPLQPPRWPLCWRAFWHGPAARVV